MIDPSTEQRRRRCGRFLRGRITATSFTNHYEWGELKGDPRKFMERWFDLHLYLANWGTRRLMIKVGLDNGEHESQFVASPIFANLTSCSLHLPILRSSATMPFYISSIGYSWLRLPPGKTLHAVAGAAGARVWIKSGYLRHVNE